METKTEYMAIDGLTQESFGIFATREEAELVARANAAHPQVLAVRSDDDARREIEAYEAAEKEWTKRAIARARDAFREVAESLGWAVREDGDDLIAERGGFRAVFQDDCGLWFNLKFFRREGILYTEDEEDQLFAGLAALEPVRARSVEWVRASSLDEPFVEFDRAVMDAAYSEPRPQAPGYIYIPY